MVKTSLTKGKTSKKAVKPASKASSLAKGKTIAKVASKKVATKKVAPKSSLRKTQKRG